MSDRRIPLSLGRENGKAITCEAADANTVALIVWAKNGSPKVVLNLSLREANGLRTLLNIAIAKASGATTE